MIENNLDNRPKQGLKRMRRDFLFQIRFYEGGIKRSEKRIALFKEKLAAVERLLNADKSK